MFSSTLKITGQKTRKELKKKKQNALSGQNLTTTNLATTNMEQISSDPIRCNESGTKLQKLLLGFLNQFRRSKSPVVTT